MKTKLNPSFIHIFALILALTGAGLLVMSILNKGQWYLTASLFLITVANFINFYATRKKNKENEK